MEMTTMPFIAPFYHKLNFIKLYYATLCKGSFFELKPLPCYFRKISRSSTRPILALIFNIQVLVLKLNLKTFRTWQGFFQPILVPL
jgi:hypothetical protein